jgi:hypothetical protein
MSSKNDIDVEIAGRLQGLNLDAGGTGAEETPRGHMSRGESFPQSGRHPPQEDVSHGESFLRSETRGESTAEATAPRLHVEGAGAETTTAATGAPLGAASARGQNRVRETHVGSSQASDAILQGDIAAQEPSKGSAAEESVRALPKQDVQATAARLLPKDDVEATAVGPLPKQDVPPRGPGPPAEGVVAGMGPALELLREVIVWPLLYAEQAAYLGVRWPRGVLLHGPPGCGKTLLVQAVAGEAGARVHYVTAGMVFGPYTGEL